MRAWLCLTSVALAGCSALIEPDARRLGDGEDAGPPILLMDSGPRDAGPQPEIDAGPGFDAGMTGSCTPRCINDVEVSCSGNVEVSRNCQKFSSFCQGTACTPWACTPNSVECSEDGSSVETCDARGSGVSVMPCATGCDPSTRSCGATTTCAGATPIAFGDSTMINLCGIADGDSYQVQGDCDGSIRANAGDATFVLTLTDTTLVEIELSDADLLNGIDTIVSVRRACGDQTSQIACDDDVPCAESTIPSTTCNSFEVRQSRIVTTLAAGTYYIVADAFVYSTSTASFECGTVRLSVGPAG